MDENDLLAKIADWTPEAKEKALTEFRARANKTRRVWYCAKGRKCDGNPHDDYDYPHARSDQWPPPGADWFLWFLMGGRGSGKTRSGSEYTRRISEKVEFMALIGSTSRDVRETMIEGESGLVRVFERAGEHIHYEPSKSRITFPSGCRANLFSAEEPDRLRGPQYGYFWGDEPAHWVEPEAVWDQLLFGLRLGSRPHGLFTSTPLPSKFVRARAAEPATRVVRVSTYANLSNLAPTVQQTILDRYEGTRLGRQELHGEILADVEGALWSEAMLVRADVSRSDLDRIIVAIDPAGSNNKRSDETGIVVVGRRGQIGYVLADRSGKYSPNDWAAEAIKLYDVWKADAIIAEKNFGGDMVRSTIETALKERDTYARVKVTTAARSKAIRAEPIVALYERGRVHHSGKFASLEEEMLTWIPGTGASPNRVDALVWGMTELFGATTEARIAAVPARQLPRRVGSDQGAKRPGIRRPITKETA